MSPLKLEVLEAAVGKQVLVIWGPGSSPQDIEALSRSLSQASKVVVENSERVSLGNYQSGSFDIVISNHLAPYSINHTFELLSEIVQFLKPNGVIYGNEKNLDSVQTSLTLAGFSSITLSSDDPPSFSAIKPNFEVGSSSKLSFAKPSVWSLSDNLMDDEVDLIKEEELLEESDLIKPAAESLRVCGTTGKRKACKDCSCGLAEEIANENESKQPTEAKATSSCGSCYLGDAFRCASCPYLGMPAFKPGEKIKLAEN